MLAPGLHYGLILVFLKVPERNIHSFPPDTLATVHPFLQLVSLHPVHLQSLVVGPWDG